MGFGWWRFQAGGVSAAGVHRWQPAAVPVFTTGRSRHRRTLERLAARRARRREQLCAMIAMQAMRDNGEAGGIVAGEDSTAGPAREVAELAWLARSAPSPIGRGLG
jgi:hypothetical protein